MKIIVKAVASAFWLAVGAAVVVALATVKLGDWLAKETAA